MATAQPITTDKFMSILDIVLIAFRQFLNNRDCEFHTRVTDFQTIGGQSHDDAVKITYAAMFWQFVREEESADGGLFHRDGGLFKTWMSKSMNKAICESAMKMAQMPKYHMRIEGFAFEVRGGKPSAEDADVVMRNHLHYTFMEEVENCSSQIYSL
jgi:hypothetical protein